MSEARKAFDWDTMFRLSLDPDRAKAVRDRRRSKSPNVCSMCGELCAMKMVDRMLSE
jgi:phosphomethylpyrimidine synthase